MEYNDELMILAFAEASKALEIGEVPVGAVFYDLNTKKIIARGCNSVNATKNATRHAELNCIDEVLDSVEKHDFEKVVVYVNVEVKLCLSNNQRKSKSSLFQRNHYVHFSSFLSAMYYVCGRTVGTERCCYVRSWF